MARAAGGARRLGRQADGGGGALPSPTFYANGAAVLLDDALGGRQPNPRAADTPPYVAASPPKIEHVGQVFGRDAQAVIAHGERDPGVAAPLLGGDVHRDFR